MSLLDKAVTQADDGTWGFQCPGVKGDRCGQEVPFSSTGWPTKKTATDRGAQHFGEHKLGAEIREATRTQEAAAITAAVAAVDDPEDLEAIARATAEAKAGLDRAAIAVGVAQESEFAVMQELHDFRVDQGLVVNDDGSVSVKDL